jgi:hypothetical protein
MTPLETLKHHVTGAIERGERVAVTAIEAPYVCDCGHPESEHSSITRGYGIDSAGKTQCYDCCTELDKADLLTAGRVCQYLSDDGKRLTNWMGRDLGRVVHKGALHPFSRERYYIRVRDCRGGMWSGVGAPGMWTVLKRVKGA